MSSDSGAEAAFRHRGFFGVIGFGSAPAVLVIDFVTAFTDPESPLGANLDAEIAQTGRVLGAARAAHAPVIYTSVGYDEHDFEDAGVWARKMSGLRTLRIGTPAVEIDPRLGLQPNEPVIVKKYASSFFGTELLTRLVTRKVDTLILTGCTTSGCVRATAVDGVQYGFRVIVAREAVGDRDRSAHEQSLFDLEAKYADVLSVDDVVRYLTSRASPESSPA